MDTLVSILQFLGFLLAACILTVILVVVGIAVVETVQDKIAHSRHAQQRHIQAEHARIQRDAHAVAQQLEQQAFRTQQEMLRVAALYRRPGGGSHGAPQPSRDGR